MCVIWTGWQSRALGCGGWVRKIKKVHAWDVFFFGFSGGDRAGLPGERETFWLFGDVLCLVFPWMERHCPYFIWRKKKDQPKCNSFPVSECFPSLSHSLELCHESKMDPAAPSPVIPSTFTCFFIRKVLSLFNPNRKKTPSSLSLVTFLWMWGGWVLVLSLLLFFVHAAVPSFFHVFLFLFKDQKLLLQWSPFVRELKDPY